ncbi:MAG TPA: hypothetical protein PLL08_07695, partial [Bacteroidales bacterium]|nr:hypothetical protein [Bacteroidales bacterium]
ALRPHGLRPRTWNRRPTPSVARGHALINIKIEIIIIILKERNQKKNKSIFKFMILRLEYECGFSN